MDEKAKIPQFHPAPSNSEEKRIQGQVLLGQERALAIIDRVVESSEADATEALLLVENTDLTRFTDLAIHQNVAEIRHQLFVRTVWDHRMVTIETNDTSTAGIQAVIRRSRDLAKGTSKRASFPDWSYSVRRSDNHDYGALPTYNPATADCGPAERALIVERTCGVFRRLGVSGAGNVRVHRLEMAVGNSSGLRRYAPFSIIGFVVTATDEARWSSGYQSWIGRDVEALDAERLAERASIKCLMGRNPQLIEARPMEVILEPPAVAQLLFHVNFRSLGLFGAKSALMRENLIFEHLGQQITSESITIRDDLSTPELVPMPFDFEGVVKQRLELISKGVARGIANDLTTAAALDQTPTGHAQPPGNAFGPLPQHLVMEPGVSSTPEMIENTEYGLLVSRIHSFVNPLSSKQGLLTGTTRDGLFLIKDGRIAGPIRNLRWMEHIFSAFGTTQAISQERQVQFTDELWFPTFALVPSLKLGRFNFVDVQRWRSEEPEA